MGLFTFMALGSRQPPLGLVFFLKLSD
ncbi:hypothetical protein GQ600_24274 [Phytophthora cactorum]|nr:hypothetical protein GQ600_24274 [Phytophthora cactorum]